MINPLGISAMLFGAEHPIVPLIGYVRKNSPSSEGTIPYILELVKAIKPPEIFQSPVIAPPSGSGKMMLFSSKVPQRPGREYMIAPGSEERFPINSLPNVFEMFSGIVANCDVSASSTLRFVDVRANDEAGNWNSVVPVSEFIVSFVRYIIRPIVPVGP